MFKLLRDPGQAPLGHLGWLRSSVGCVLGIGATVLAGSVLLGASSPALPWLIAPTGASAVLVFGLPASPLAQPWPVIGGSILSAAAGLLFGHLLGSPMLAASVAIGVSIAIMSLTNCLHPPGGACALVYALGAAGPEAWGAAHLLTILANVLALSAIGWVYNDATGHSWPSPCAGRCRSRTRRSIGSSPRRAHRCARRVDEVIDADIEDLDAIFLAVERRIRSREDNALRSMEG